MHFYLHCIISDFQAGKFPSAAEMLDKVLLYNKVYDILFD